MQLESSSILCRVKNIMVREIYAEMHWLTRLHENERRRPRMSINWVQRKDVIISGATRLERVMLASFSTASGDF
jgi:hypothetical protein